MKLPWWHDQHNPNGFYPDPPPPEPPEPDIDFCHCCGCGQTGWTFEAEEAWQWIAKHVTHSGNITVTPAGHVYQQLVDAVLHDAAHTIGPRT